MNTIIIQAATIADPSSPLNGKVVDLRVADGKIEIYSGTPGADDKVIDGKGSYLVPGFFDLNVNFGDPGLETKEDLITGTAAAAAGGFTGLALMPNTKPPVHSKAEVAYLVNKAKGGLVNVYPLGCVSHLCEGKELAEMYDMKKNGAIAFTDGKKPVSNAGLLSRALQYTKSFEGLIISFAEDQDIAGSAKMHEGEVSTYLGMKGNPSLAEELMVSRDLYLAEYNDAPIHFTTISTAKSVELIRQAKKAGLKVTCDVAAHALVLTDEDLKGFDSNYKVKPPLRTKADQEALIAGLKDGTIDAVVSQHTPHEVEFKNVEFEIASYGIIGLQTVVPVLLQAGFEISEIVRLLSVGPRKVLGLPVPTIAEGAEANFVLLDPAASWTLDGSTNLSRSENSPFFGQSLTGKVKLVYNNAQYQIF